MSRGLVVVGDTLLDRDIDGHAERLCPDAPAPVLDDVRDRARPGGAGLAAVLAAADGREVTLVTALGRDAAADELRGLLAGAGVRVVDLGLDGATPEKVRVRADGRSLVRIDRGGAAGSVAGRSLDCLREALRSAGCVLVSDYGCGAGGFPGVRQAVSDTGAPVVWDPHPRGAEPVPGCTLVTPNRAEAAHFAGRAAVPDPGDGGGSPGSMLATVTARAQALRARWSAGAVAVTLGAQGALLVHAEGVPLVVPAPPVACLDPCGAGDRFAATAAALLADGALPSEAVTAAVHSASAFVAAGGAAQVDVTTAPAPPAPPVGPARSAYDLVATVRSRGGTVVATGGCFDLLHAGHVSVLEAARALGDCLVVCLNSDASVRRLKGAGRPAQPAADRARVLLALGCVDAVVEFDEDTPTAVLDRLRPDVWAKGGDYALTDLPEAEVLARYGGQAVVLPYLAGRSTSALLASAHPKEDAARGA